MKRYILSTLTMAALSVFTAQATLIDLGITTGQPSGPTDELARLDTQVNTWNADLANQLNPLWKLPDATGWSYTKTDTENVGNVFTLGLTDFSGYLMMKWGNMDHFYYVTGETDLTLRSTVTVTTSGGRHGITTTGPSLGLSHYSLWEQPSTRVPDGGTTAGFMLAGVGAIILGRRKLR